MPCLSGRPSTFAAPIPGNMEAEGQSIVISKFYSSTETCRFVVWIRVVKPCKLARKSLHWKW